MINREFLHHISSKITIQPQIKRIGKIYVAGIRGTATLNNIFSLWQQFGEKLDSISSKHLSARTFGICEYQENMPVAKYAVFTHKGLLRDILKTYQYIWGTWAVLTSETIDNRDDFELYDEGFFGKENDNSEVAIYIPIK